MSSTSEFPVLLHDGIDPEVQERDSQNEHQPRLATIFHQLDVLQHQQRNSMLQFEQLLFRKLTESEIAAFLAAEGAEMKQYGVEHCPLIKPLRFIHIYAHYIRLLSGRRSIPDSNPERRALTCIYTILRGVESELHQCLLPYEVAPLLLKAIECSQRSFLHSWPPDAASSLTTKIDIWIKRDRPPLLATADIEAACKCTAAVLYQLRALWIAQPEHESSDAAILWSLDQAIDRLIDTLEKVPASHYSGIVWSEISKKDTHIAAWAKQILYAYITFGKLQAENAHYPFPPIYLLAKYSEIHVLLQFLIRQQPLLPHEATIKNLSHHIYSSWHSSFPLLYPPVPPVAEDTLPLLLRNLRVLRRLRIVLRDCPPTEALRVLLDEAIALMDERLKSLPPRPQQTDPGDSLLAELASAS